MSTTPATVQQLLQDLYDHEEVSYEAVSGDGLFFTYFRGKPQPPGCWVDSTSQNICWFRAEEGVWGLWSVLDVITVVQFVRGAAHDDPEREMRGIRFLSAKDGPSFGFWFEGLYDEQKRPVPARFARWDALRAKRVYEKGASGRRSRV
jgi:hypothetical protein